jgi:hypothetical protein
VHSLRDHRPAVVPRRAERLEPFGGGVQIPAHQPTFAAGLQLGLLLGLADSGGEDGGECAA